MNNNPYINEIGTKYWKNHKGQLHRIDGPAIEDADGTKTWYVDGKLHRINGPAAEGYYGYKSWFFNGKRHRLDGPSVENSPWVKNFWFVNEQNISEINNFINLVTK